MCYTCPSDSYSKPALASVICFAENYFVGNLGKATCTVCSIFVQTSKEEVEYTKAKEQLRCYLSNLYTVKVGKKEMAISAMLLIY